jgi:hypothetical protein
MPGHRRFPYFELRHLWRPATVAAALAALALVTVHPASAAKQGEEHFKVRAAVSLPNGQKVLSFDISSIDEVNGLYLLADRTNKAVDAIDVLGNGVAAQYTANFAGIVGGNFNAAGPNGILTIGGKYLWAGDFCNGSNGCPPGVTTGGVVRVINEFTGALVTTISTGGTARADELCYDSRNHIVMIANDAEALPSQGGTGPYVTFIDSKTYNVLGRIYMDGQNGRPLATNGIEQCQWRKKTDKFYLNIPEVNGPGNDTADGAVLVIDPTTMQIVKTFDIPVNQCSGPQGMALGPSPQILLGCNDPNKNVPQSITIDQKNGSIINTFPGEDGPDEVWYDPGDGHYFLAESGGANPQHLGIIDAVIARELKIGREDESLKTGIAGGGGAHSVAAESFTNKVFVPIPSTAGAGVCSSVGGDDSVGCIAVYRANSTRDEGE